MKRSVIILILTVNLLFSGTSFADECMEGDCDNGTGTGYTEAGHIYSGEWKDGEPHGLGKLTISKKKHLEGRWKKGKLVDENNKTK